MNEWTSPHCPVCHNIVSAPLDPESRQKLEEQFKDKIYHVGDTVEVPLVPVEEKSKIRVELEELLKSSNGERRS